METDVTVKVLKALADENRLKIMRQLGQRSVCVCEMESLLSLSQPAVSHHLRILREAGLVTNMRQGKWIYYSLDRNRFVALLESLHVLAPSSGSSESADLARICEACELIIN